MRTAFVFLLWSLYTLTGGAEPLRLAVASNFTEPARALITAYEETSAAGEITLSTGSTGQLFFQITQGAPYDLFLAADQARPARLAEMGLGVADSQITYASGQLALWAPRIERARTVDASLLKDTSIHRYAVAHPLLAPYGRAALQTINNLGVAHHRALELVRGENVAQAFAMVASGNVEAGLVAVSHIRTHRPALPTYQYWIVPQALYDPIAQDAIIISHTKNAPQAQLFLAFLMDKRAGQIIQSFGYERP